jgi:23S rRNA pseudouridine1911/1915/1917 synthase
VPIRSERRTLLVPDDLDGRPLDGALRRLLGISWGDARELVARGKVKVDGEVVLEGGLRARAGQSIAIDPGARRPAPVDRGCLVYVDPHLVVVNKPAGISTVAFDPGERGTLDQLVAALLRPPSRAGPAPSVGVVQRLDKETSGLIVFARTFAVKKALAQQLRQRTVKRRYLAIAHGRVQKATLRSHLVEDRGDGLRGSSRHGREGQLAITHVEPLEELTGATLVACRLETGRTHQIRIHLAEAGHPLLGERVYRRDHDGGFLPAPRIMLHAAELGFAHPVRESPMHFEIEPPADFSEVLARLRGASREGASK